VRTIYIVRHGQTEWNLAGRMQGRLDSPLTDLGRRQASANGALIKSLGGVDQLWVSPAGRTTETAYLVNSHTKAPLHFAEELVERDCGLWSGMTIDEIRERHAQSWSEREQDPYWHQPPQGENMQDMLLRSHRFLDDLFELDWDALALVTHGVMSKVILKFFLGLDDSASARVRHPNDLVYRLTITAQDIETHHFLGGGEGQPGLLRAATSPSNHPGRK
jgi:probable phosphoglycerate mutase